MAGSLIVTNLNPQTAINLITAIAEEEGFEVERVEQDELTINKNSAAMSIFFGGLFFPYARFRAFVAPVANGQTEIEFERNNPWWQGWLGIIQLKSLFKKLVHAIEDEIERIGGHIFNSDDIS